MIKRVPGIWLALLLLLTVIASLVVVKMLRSELVQAAAPTAGVTWTCSPDLVVSANVRVVAHCASGYVINGTTTIRWFAYPTQRFRQRLTHAQPV